jgi:adenylate cyclase
MSEGQRKLAAVMFTDMIGYTALGQTNESLSLALVDEQRKLVRPILRRHNGREVKTIGDAFLVEFPNALDAVRCAYDIQRATREFNLSLSESRRIHLRVGIHLGDIEESEGDISGDAVNVASRIEPLSEDGGVCVTRQVYDHVRGKIDLQLTSVGLKSLKNVAEPLEVFKMDMPWAATSTSRKGLERRRIAVLPFASLSPDPNDEYFADGLTEELITRISLVKGIEVIARTSVMGFKKKDKKVSEIAKELSVGTILEGSVRKAGNRVRVTAQLIDSNTEGHLWAETYDRNLDDIFAVQSDVATKVAESIPNAFLNPEKMTIKEKDTDDIVAYTHFLQGRYLVNKLEEEPLRQALSNFELATSRDPNFARAFVGVSRCYALLAEGGYLEWQVSIEKGRAAVMQALAINPDLAEAHSSLADLMMMGDENIGVQKAEIMRALALNPNLEDAYMVLANLCAGLGDTSEMVRAAERAYELDPLSPRAISVLGTVYFAVGRDLEAMDHWNKTLYLEPYRTYRCLFDFYVSKGDYQKAEQMVKELDRIGPNLEYTYLNRGYLAALTGDLETAREMINKLDSTHQPGWARSSSAGFIYYALGDLDKFFEYMFRSVEDHTVPISLKSSFLRYNPLLTKARKDPRFAEIFHRAGLPYAKEN